MVQQEDAITEPHDALHRVSNEDDRRPALAQLTNPSIALLLKTSVAHGDDLVDQKDVRLRRDGGGKGETKKHPGGVGADWPLKGFADLGKCLNRPLAPGQVAGVFENDFVEEAQVLPPRELRDEAAGQIEKSERPS